MDIWRSAVVVEWAKLLLKLRWPYATFLITIVILCLKSTVPNLLSVWQLEVGTGAIKEGYHLSVFSLTKSQRSTLPIQHVYYLKTHKTGSSTIFSVLAQYCNSHGLLALLPSGVHINQRTPLLPAQQLMLDPRILHYDMVFNHQVYDPAVFKYLHNDTFKFTTIREPFKHFVSSFAYFRSVGNMGYLTSVRGYKDPISVFLSNPSKFEANGYSSYTNNRQSIDLGYEIHNHTFSDINYIQAFIKETEKRFDLVLITDYFLESIVLLKRALHWQTQDVLFYEKNVLLESHSLLVNMTPWHRQKHKEFSIPDIQLYQYFLSVFKFRMSQAVGLEEEVSELREILDKVRRFCNLGSIVRDRTLETIRKLEIPVRRWSDKVSLDRAKCKWLSLEEISFTKYLQKQRIHRLKMVPKT
ncbi:galactose-3-o-sulfotransferase 3 [Plakobranchus ocellatus]|uniref:Galactose-3-o-sulfotransferase 3 n=1 Tax=Plakobranchus ocellatus TaxID=259542 RepID=A0AAV4CKM0_9GAST|nr:galactose-3-o-sulfotransferase 3 [Plakobranchus ocellatus]